MANHPHELTKREETIVHLDYATSGIGSNSCGPELLTQYRLNQKDIKFNIRMKPILISDIDIMNTMHSQILNK